MNRNAGISPPLTPFSLVLLTRSSARSLRKAAATMASPPGQRRAAIETRGTTRWKATHGCTTSRRFPWRNPCYPRTGTSWRWSTAGRPRCLHSAVCCRNSTEPCPCPSGPVLIQRQEENLAASHFPGTAASMLSWLPLLLLIRGNRSTIHWTGPGMQVRFLI